MSPSTETATSVAPRDDFRRLVALVGDNERLLAALGVIRSKTAAAWAELDRPGSHPALILGHLERLRAKKSALLAELRANRIEARALIGRPLPGDEPETWPEPSNN